MSMSKGDKVIALRDINPGIFGGTKVPKGTKGKVAAVEGFWSTTYTVRFENGEIEDCREGDSDEL